MTRPQVALLGIFGRTNLGNEATLAAFLSNFRQHFPAGRAVCIAPRDSSVGVEHGLDHIDLEPLPVRRYFAPYHHRRLARAVSDAAQRATEPLRARRAEMELRGLDALVIPGTGVLDDFGQGPLDLPFHLLRWCRAASRISMPIYMLGVGTERVQSRRIRQILARAASLCDYRSYRDQESRENAAWLGIPVENDQVIPDLAFSLPPASLPVPASVTWPPRSVGLGVMGYYGWNQPAARGEEIYLEYLEGMKRFASWLLMQGHSIRFLVGDTRLDPRPARELLAALGGPSSRVSAEPITTFSDLLQQIALTDLVVASRLHNLVLALLLGRPAISISYSTKNDALLAEFGLGCFCQPIETFSVERLCAQFEKLASAPSPAPEVCRKVQVLRTRLASQYQQVFSAMASHGRPARAAR